MSQQLYTNASIYVDNKHLAEQASIGVDRKTNSQQVFTQGRMGLGGITPGAAYIEIKVESAVPAVDFEMDPGQFFTDGLRKCDVTVFAGGRSLTSEGWILDDNFSVAVNSEAKLSFTIICEMAKWQG